VSPPLGVGSPWHPGGVGVAEGVGLWPTDRCQAARQRGVGGRL